MGVDEPAEKTPSPDRGLSSNPPTERQQAGHLDNTGRFQTLLGLKSKLAGSLEFTDSGRSPASQPGATVLTRRSTKQSSHHEQVGTRCGLRIKAG